MVQQQIKELIDKISQYISSYKQLTMIECNRGCVDGEIIGTGRADFTQNSTEYNLTIGDKTFVLIDIPGIEGDESRFEDVIQKSLDKAHTIFYVNGSGKKTEPATLEKIKKYMHDGTSVYAIYNVHCKGRKKIIPGIDKPFEEELSAEYLKKEDIIRQDETNFNSFLGKNYKGSLSLNGLLSFCGYAIDASGKTTIKYEKDKNLRSNQEKYIKEYSGNITRLREDSHIKLVQDIIEDKVDSFEDDIYKENIKKLNSRIGDMIVKIDNLKAVENKKIDEFITTYNEFESNCRVAKDDYIHTVKHIGYNATADVFENVKSDLFDMIDKDKGKIDSKKVQKYFDTHKNEIIKNIENLLNAKMNQAQKDYENAIEDARQRLIKDFQRKQINFEISLSAKAIELDDSFADALKYNLKSFGGDLVCVSSLVLSGVGIGTAVMPGIGTVIGAFVGAILGVLGRVWNYFASEAKRISRAKEKLQQTIDDQIDEVSANIKNELKNLDFEEKINDSYNQIYNQAEKQKEALESVKALLNNVYKNLKMNNNKLSQEEKLYV